MDAIRETYQIARRSQDILHRGQPEDRRSRLVARNKVKMRLKLRGQPPQVLRRFVHDIVRKHAWIRDNIRALDQRMCDLAYRPLHLLNWLDNKLHRKLAEHKREEPSKDREEDSAVHEVECVIDRILA